MMDHAVNHDQSDTLVELAKAPNSAVAGLWASILDAAGIVKHVSRASIVWVPRSKLDDARRLIENWKLQSQPSEGPNEWIDNP
jgi:hypothetical protein